MMTRVEEAIGFKEVVDIYIEKALSVIDQWGEDTFQNEILFFPQESHPKLGKKRKYHPLLGPLYLDMFGGNFTA